jgi:hypothetical protein
MAQKQIKPKSVSQLAKAQIAKKSANQASRGIRINPKKAVLIKEKAIQKKLSARNIQNTERQMAVKAGQTGKLTIMKRVADEAKDVKK